MPNRKSSHAATVTLISGDGIGPEVAAAAVRLLEAAGARIEWEEIHREALATLHLEDHHENPAVESLRRTRVGLKGPLTTQVAKGNRSLNVALRRKLDLYCNLRPVKRLPGVKTPFDHVDLIVVR